jgi:thymidylate synthase
MTYEEQYRKLLINIIKEGDARRDRTGVGTKALFNKQLSIQLLTNRKSGSNKITGENFPILSGKHMSQKIFDTEFEWFMRGETNIQRFKDNNVTIWDNWATPEGDLGPVYGYQLRNFNGQDIDQLKNLIDSINNNRHSRRHIISLWNPAMIEQMALPPCYLYFQFYVYQGKLNMFVVQRSGDMFLGVPYDVCLFTKIMLYVASETNTLPNKLDISIIDAHIYTNHFDAIGKYIEQTDYKDDCSFSYESGNLILNNYKPGPIIKAEVAV